MAKRPLLKQWWLWVAIAAVIAAGGVWIAQLFTAPAVQEPTKATTTELAVTPQVLTTSDAYSRYVERVTTGKAVLVEKENIVYAQDVDWNTEELVAVQFPLLAAKSITAAGIEQVDGKNAYVVDVLDVYPCTPHTQNDTVRLVFIKQPSGASVLPVILRTTPNMATCDGLR